MMILLLNDKVSTIHIILRCCHLVTSSVLLNVYHVLWRYSYMWLSEQKPATFAWLQTELYFIAPAYSDTKCDPAWENRAYVHKVHLFTLFQLSHHLCKLSVFCNWIRFLIVCCTSYKSLIDKLCFGIKLWNFKFQKVAKFYVHISPIFSCRYLHWLMSTGLFFYNGFC